MRRGKRTIGILALAAALMAAVSGCHGSRVPEEFAVPAEAHPDKGIEISFWAKNDTNKTQTDIYQQAIRDFEACYPGIRVNLRLYTNYGKIYNDVITNIRTNTTPNVCITYPDHIATYRTGQGVVVPLDELMADPRYGLGGSEVKFDGPKPGEIIPEYLAECRIGEEDGTLYALPYMRSSEACYVNKTMVEALGYTLPEGALTWDFIWEVSEAAMRTKGADGVFGVNGQRVLIPFLYKSTDNMMIQYLKQRGAPYSDAAGSVYLFGDETKEFLSGIASHVQTGAFSTFKISGYPANFLNAGQCIFAVDSTAGSTWMGSEAPLVDISEDSVVSFETAVYPAPQVDPDHLQMISQGPSICLFNKKDPDEVLASWLFVQYLLTNDVQISYAETEGYVPVTTAARKDPRYQAYLEGKAWNGSEAVEPSESKRDHFYSVKREATRLVLDHTADTFVTPVFNGSASLRDAAGELIESTVKGIRRKQTADDAFFTKLYADTKSLYRLGESRPADAQEGAVSEGSLGPLPAVSAALLIVLALSWVGIGVVSLRRYLRKRASDTRE
ncbi:MAG: extracellular solute-binding protein [Lachnospiraceae bacterium]|nr:extracellular solute-binding protein [Lachnospiraceae bacterium]